MKVENLKPLFLVIPMCMGPWIHRYSEAVEYLNCKVIFNQEISGEDLVESLKTATIGSMSKEDMHGKPL